MPIQYVLAFKDDPPGQRLADFEHGGL